MAKQLIITCLGGIFLEVDSIEITNLSKKAKAIIVYLACNPSEHQREKIADIFWGSSQSKITSARNNLRGQITQLRKALAPYLIFSRETISFNTDAQYRLDVAELNLAVKKYTIPREENYTVSNLVKLQIALSLYQGDFLDGFYLPDAELFEEWAFGQRESLKFTVINGFLHLITGYRILNNYIDGIRWAHRVLEIDPYNETAHSQLIYLLAANGQRGLAIEHFQHYQKKIRQELNIPPGPQIEEIYQQILQADIVPQIVTLDPGLLSSTPYKGLNPFKETDWFDFYGREEFVKRLVKAVYSRPIIAVIGPSGCGKTSVVKAGLLPQLRSNMPLSRKIVHHLDRQFHWLTIEFRPGSQPFHSLASALVPFLSKETTETEILIEAQKLATTLRKKELMLSVVIKRILALKEENNLLTENLMRFPSRILLVINQFEEIFTLCDDPKECQTFIDILLGGIKTFKELTQSDYSLVFTLRADLMGQVLLHRILADALQESTEILGTMTRKELTQAIKSPAQSRGVEFESGLLERILDDVGDSPGNLPLLEFAMTQLWDVRDGNLLRHSGYDNIGQVEGALARYAEHVYNTLSPNEKKLVKAISSQLVNPGEGTEDIRRQTKRSELSGEGWQLVQKLADARLVVTGIDPNGHEIVEIIHEALIHGWDRMSAWVNEDRDFRIWQEKLRAAIHQWESGEYDNNDLFRGGRLDIALDWQNSRPQQISQIEHEFIRKSKENSERIEAEKTLQQRQKIEAAEQLAKTQKIFALKQQSINRRLRVITILLVIAFIGSVSFGFLFYNISIENANNAATATVAQGQTLIEKATALAAQALAQDEANRALIEAKARTTQQTLAEEQRALAEAEALARATQQAKSDQLAKEAQENLALAEAQRLASEAKLLIESGKPADLIALLAIQSYRLRPTRQVGEILSTATFLDYPIHILDIPQMTDIARYSPDSKSILAARDDGKLSMFDLETSRVVSVLDSSGAFIRNISFSKDGNSVFLIRSDGIIQHWDLKSKALLRTFSIGLSTEISVLAHNHKSIFVAKEKQIIQVDLETQKIIREFNGHSDDILNLTLFPNSPYLLSTSKDYTTRIWDIQTGKTLQILRGHTNDVHMGIVSPDEKLIMTESFDQTAKIWDWESGETLLTISDHIGGVSTLAFSPNGKIAVTAGWDGLIRFWDTTTWANTRVLRGHNGVIGVVNFSPDGKYLFSKALDQIGLIWSIETKSLPILYGHTANVTSGAISSDGKYILTGSIDRTARIWDIKSGELIHLLEGHDEAINNGAAFSPDGKNAATVGWGGQMNLWDVETGNKLKAYSTGFPLNGVAFSPDGKFLATGGWDSIARIWDIQTGTLVQELSGHTGLVYGVAFSTDGKKLVTVDAFDKQPVTVWDVKTGEILLKFGGHKDGVTALAVSPNGRFVLTGGAESTPLIWNIETGEVIHELKNHTGFIWAAAFSSDGKYALTGSGDNTVRLWDVETGEEIRRFIGHTGAVEGVAFSPDSKYILSVSDDFTGRIWLRDPKDEVELLCSLLRRDLTDLERANYGIHANDPTCP